MTHQMNHDSTHEVRWMHAAQYDPQAFEPIYARYVDRVFAYCLRRVSSPSDAEDLTSHIFTRALTMISTYRGGLVSAWLFQIAANTVNDYHRRYGQRQYQEQVSLDDDPFSETIDAADPTPDQLDHIVHEEDLQRIRDLLQLIPADQRELLDLKLSGGLDSSEIGQVVGKSATAVRSIIHRALRRLHALYQQAEGKEQRESEGRQ